MKRWQCYGRRGESVRARATYEGVERPNRAITDQLKQGHNHADIDHAQETATLMPMLLIRRKKQFASEVGNTARLPGN